MREKLIEMIAEQEMVCNYANCTECGYSRIKPCRASMIADHLIANGVTIQDREEIDFDYAAEVE